MLGRTYEVPWRKLAGYTIAFLSAGLSAGLMHQWLNQAPAPRADIVRPVETSMVLVAASDIGPGKQLTSGDLVWRAWPRDHLSPQYVQQQARPRAAADLLGSIVRTPLVQGEPLLLGKLEEIARTKGISDIIPDGLGIVSVSLSNDAGLSQLIRPNDRVDVIVTSTLKVDEQELFDSQTVLSNILVVAVDGRIFRSNQRSTSPARNATLALTAEDAARLASAKKAGSITLMLRGQTDMGSQNSGCSARIGRVESVRIIRRGSSSRESFYEHNCR